MGRRFGLRHVKLGGLPTPGGDGPGADHPGRRRFRERAPADRELDHGHDDALGLLRRAGILTRLAEAA